MFNWKMDVVSTANMNLGAVAQLASDLRHKQLADVQCPAPDGPLFGPDDVACILEALFAVAEATREEDA